MLLGFCIYIFRIAILLLFQMIGMVGLIDGAFELVLYWFHNHSSLFLGMVIRWFLMLVNISALSCMICIVGSTVFMSISRLHSLSCIWTRGSCSGSCMYLVFLDFIWWKFFSIIS